MWPVSEPLPTTQLRMVEKLLRPGNGVRWASPVRVTSSIIDNKTLKDLDPQQKL